MNTKTASDWELVVACLSPTQGRVRISREATLAAQLLCDGMGRLHKADVDPVDNYPASDWSHVRDSSDHAVAACGTYLRTYLDMSLLVDRANEALAAKDLAAYRDFVDTLTSLGLAN